MVVDAPSDPSPAKALKGKGKGKADTRPATASVDDLWASSTPAHSFPESWIGEARSESLFFFFSLSPD